METTESIEAFGNENAVPLQKFETILKTFWSENCS